MKDWQNLLVKWQQKFGCQTEPWKSAGSSLFHSTLSKLSFFCNLKTLLPRTFNLDNNLARNVKSLFSIKHGVVSNIGAKVAKVEYNSELIKSDSDEFNLN